MARESGEKRSVIPRLSASRFKRHSELKNVSPLRGGSKLETDAPQETGSSRVDSASLTPSTKEEKRAPPHDDTNSPSSSSSHNTIKQTSIPDPSAIDPIFLAEDFAALIKLPAISRHENLWIDLWQQAEIGPLNEQYLSSLKSFVGLRCLRVTGMLKSYQKQLFQAIWKMERLEDLQLRMAEEPSLTPGVGWRRIEKGWVPSMQEGSAYISPGDGKGRIKKQYGNGEYFDNCVIELAKPKLAHTHPEFESWMTRLLPIVHLTLRGFVVDAIPFCSCFDGERLRSITLVDCYDAGFYLPHEMDGVEIRADGSTRTARMASMRQVSPGDRQVRSVTLKGGKKVEERTATAAADTLSRGRHCSIGYIAVDENRGRRRHVDSSSSSPASPSPSRQSGSRARTSRFPWHFRSRPVSAVIEEDERES